MPESLGNTDMEKAQILDAIRRLAATNGVKALGSQRFESETGLGKADWYPKYWLRWGDAIREAGCEPNSFSTSFSEEFLIQKYVGLALELGRFPIEGDLIVKRRGDRTFPNRGAFSRLGNKSERVAKILAYCRARDGFEDAIPLVAAAVVAQSLDEDGSPDEPPTGYVYLSGTGRVASTRSAGRTIQCGGKEKSVLSFHRRLTPFTSSRQMILQGLRLTGIAGFQRSD